MKKIPTLFKRNAEQMSRVTREVHPDCQWVLDGEGVATRKYDGTCVIFTPVVKGEVRLNGGVGSGEIQQPGDLSGAWLARREVKAEKTPPPGFIPVQTDALTLKTVGWEPIEQSSFFKAFTDALSTLTSNPYFGTYELCGPKVNGNPEHYERHALVRHADAEHLDAPRDFNNLMAWLLDLPFEGVVWHHVDGRMAKIKRRDALASLPSERTAPEEKQ